MMSNSKNEFRTEGIHVCFPYELYKPQEYFIENLIKALTQGSNALLESPTGTGKTLCLLCGALAWQKAVIQGKVPHPIEIRKKKKNVNDDAEVKCNDFWDKLQQFSYNESDFNLVKEESFVQGDNISSKIELTETDKLIELTPPTIFLASRTHAQLAQITSELKKTCFVTGSIKKNQLKANNPMDYAHDSMDPSSVSSFNEDFFIRVTTLASRDHFCINKSLSNLKGHSLITACQQKIKKKLCYYELGVHKCKVDTFETPHDIEDLRLLGLSQGFCPYFVTKENVSKCQLVLLPYEYILNARMRKLFKLSLTNSVIIFDEGHNIEKVAEEMGSFDLLIDDLHACYHIISKLLTSSLMSNESRWIENVEECFLNPVDELIDTINKAELNPPSSEYPFNHSVLPGENLLYIFQNSGLTSTKIHLYEDVVLKCSEWVYSEIAELNTNSKGDLDYDAEQKMKKFSNDLRCLESLVSMITTVFSVSLSEIQWFRLFIHEKNSSGVRDSNYPPEKTLLSDGSVDTDSIIKRTLSFWCFNPGIILQELVLKEKIHSLIITSGTLSPLKNYCSVLGGFGAIKYDVLVENDHVISSKQLYVRIITHYGKDMFPLRLNIQKNRNDTKLIDSIGLIISDISSIIPGGIIVFFSSYIQLNSIVKRWKSSNIWRQINKYRVVYEEPSSSSTNDFNSVLNGYQATVNKCSQDRVMNTQNTSNRDGLLLAVIRGKVSEGLSLANDLCRCVVIVGIPYPNLADSRIRMKQSILDAAFPGKHLGEKWYHLQTCKAVNQAIGRIIRHINDYGSILLIDERFALAQNHSNLSRWIRTNITHTNIKKNYDEIISNLYSFYSSMDPNCVSKMIKANALNLNDKSDSNDSQAVFKKQKTQNSGESKSKFSWKKIHKDKIVTPSKTLLHYFNAKGNPDTTEKVTSEKDFSSRINGAFKKEMYRKSLNKDNFVTR